MTARANPARSGWVVELRNAGGIDRGWHVVGGGVGTAKRDAERRAASLRRRYGPGEARIRAVKANPSARQRRRSAIKHKAAQQGLRDRRLFGGELGAAVRRQRATATGRTRQHGLKGQRRTGGKSLASQLRGILL